MSFETIFIHTQIPIINGYAQYLDNKPSDKTRVTAEDAKTAISGSKIYSLNKSNKKGSTFLRLPGRNPGVSFAVDPKDLLS